MISSFALKDLLFIIPLLAIYTYLVLRLTFKERADIVNTGDDGILITLGNGLLFGGMILSILFGIFSINFTIAYINDPNERLFSYIFVTILVIPIFILFYQYLNLKKFYVKKFKLSKPVPNDKLRTFSQKIEGLSKILHLKKAPEILISDFHNLQPFIFGYNEKRSYLVIPRNFDKLTADSSLSIYQRNILEKFLYLHELSHIHNKDLGFISVAFVLLRMIWPWLFVLLTLAPLFIGPFQYLDKISLFFYIFVFPLLAISYILLLVLHFTLSKNREYLADACALLNIRPKEGEELCKDFLSIKNEKKSLFGYLLFRLKILPVYIKSENIESIKNIVHQKVSQFIKYIYSFSTSITVHPKDDERSRNIEEKKVFYESRVSPNKTSSFFIGAIIAIMVNMVINISLMIIFYEAIFKIDLDLHGNWHLFFLALLLIFIPAFFFNYPLSNSVNKRIRPYTFTSQFVKSYAISFTAFLLVSWILTKINLAFFQLIHLDNMKLESFLTIEVMFLTIVYICIMLLSFGTSFVIREKIFKEELGEVVLVFLITVFSFFGIIFFLGEFYYSYAIHINVIFATEIALVVYLFLLINLFAGGLINDKIFLSFGSKNVIINYNKKNLIDTLIKFTFAGSVIGIVFIGLPLVVFNHVLFVLSEKFLISNDTMALIVVIFTIIVVFAVMLKGPENKLEDIWSKMSLADELGISISEGFDNIIEKTLVQKKSTKGGYIIDKSYKISFMESNYYGALLERHLYGKANDDTINCILECEDKEGGFKDYKGGFGHLESTFFAIDILKREGLLGQISIDKHMKWLIDQSKSNLESIHQDKAALRNLFYFLSSFEILNPNAIKNIPIIENELLSLWDATDKNFENFCYISKIISLVSPYQGLVLERFKLLWLDVFWKAILKIDFKGNLKDVAFFVLSVKSLKPNSSTEIRQSLKVKMLNLKF